MKVGVWSALCCLLLVTWFLDVSDTVCTDSDDSWCSKDKCDQHGIKNKCMKTCGLCDDKPGQTICRNGTWGRGCTESCSVGCVDRVCYKESGGCDTCKPCYEGPRCTDVSHNCTCTSKGSCECKARSYGEACVQKCSEGCLYKTCNSNGTCRLECDSGLHCLNETCNSSRSCTLGCDTGWFGTSCEQLCPENCHSDTCSRLDGSCTSCHGGYTGFHCNISCPENCEGETCNQTDGTCPACKVGWFSRRCDHNCSHCKTSLVGNNCDHQTGSCLQGCTEGWFGDKCEQTCSEGCQKKLCDQETGICTKGCLSGVYGEFCSKSRVSGLVVWVVLPVLVITLLLIAIVVLVARLMRIESFKKHTNQMPVFYQGSPEGALSLQGDEVPLASRDHRPLPPLPGGPSPDTMYSEPKVEAEEPESYIIIRHL